MNTNEPSKNESNRKNPGSPKKNNATLIVIIILVVVFSVIILGVGGYFGWKYFKSKITTSADATTNKTKLSNKMQDLVDLFKYPGATIKDSNPSDNSAEFTQETSDSLQTAYDYYDQMIKLNNWTEGSNSYAPTETGAWLIITQKDFSNIIQFSNEDSGKVSISFSITTDNNLVTSTHKKPATKSNTSSNTTKTTISTDYVIADSNTRILTSAELVNLTPWQLKISRNEIYARHGRAFVHKDMNCYFGAKGWYTVNQNYSSSDLTAIDNKNVATILAYENSIGSTIIDVDTGGC